MPRMFGPKWINVYPNEEEILNANGTSDDGTGQIVPTVVIQIEWKRVGLWCLNRFWRQFQRYSQNPFSYLRDLAFLSMPHNIIGSFKVQGTWLVVNSEGCSHRMVRSALQKFFLRDNASRPMFTPRRSMFVVLALTVLERLS